MWFSEISMKFRKSRQISIKICFPVIVRKSPEKSEIRVKPGLNIFSDFIHILSVVFDIMVFSYFQMRDREQPGKDRRLRVSGNSATLAILETLTL